MYAYITALQCLGYALTQVVLDVLERIHFLKAGRNEATTSSHDDAMHLQGAKEDELTAVHVHEAMRRSRLPGAVPAHMFIGVCDVMCGVFFFVFFFECV